MSFQAVAQHQFDLSNSYFCAYVGERAAFFANAVLNKL
jgi:hypothetical protein